MVMVIEEGEVCWGEFLALGILNAFGCSARTSVLIDKQRTRIDSACMKGAETAFLGILIVGGDGDGRG